MISSPGRNLLRTIGLAAGACLLALAGCQNTDAWTYKSYSYAPQTVTLVNWTTGEKLWTCEIPVGQQLEVKFSKTPNQAEAQGSDVMFWSLAPIGDDGKGKVSELQVPPPSQRRLDVSYRQAGEQPPTAPLPTETTPPSTSPAKQPRSAEKKPGG